MTDVDTSSYLKVQPQPALLDNVQKYQQIQSNGLGIDKQKLDLVNQRVSTMAKQFTGLANKPDLNEDDIRQQIQQDVQFGLVTPEMAATAISQIPAKATPQQLKAHLEQFVTNAMSMAEAVNFHYGTPGFVSNNQQQQPVLQGPQRGLIPTGPGIQMQPPPTTSSVATGANPNVPAGTPQQLGPYGGSPLPFPVQGPPGALPAGPVASSAVPGQSSNFGGRVTGATVGPDQGPIPVGPRLNATPGPAAPTGPSGPVTGTSPLFETGKAQYAQDQELATQKLTAIKPALQALPLLKGIMSGPGTASYTNAVAGLKAFGIIPTDVKDDPTAIRQEVVKKLNQYVSANPVGQRSDAAQTLAEASSPSPNVQILPALTKLTKDAIMLDRVQAARPGAFKDTDFSKYGSHRSTFPAKIDEKAFGLDLMDPEDRQALLDQMKKKASTPEGKKFWNSLQTAKDSGVAYQ